MKEIYLIISIILIMASIRDIKKKEIPVYVLILLTVMTTLSLTILSPNINLNDILLSLIPGISLLSFGIISHQLGIGDALLLIILGPVLGLSGIIKVLFLGLIISFVISAILLLLKKGTWKTRIPFCPIITFSYITLLITEAVV